MPATQPPSEEKQYGAVQAEEAAAQQTAAIPPLEQTVFENVAPPAPVEQGAQQPPPEQQKPNMWRIPANYEGILGPQPKSAIERFEDYGRLWAVLAADPNVDPVVRNIASLLSRGE